MIKVIRGILIRIGTVVALYWIFSRLMAVATGR